MNLKKNFCKRLLSVLLLLAMCITSLIACNVSSNDKDTTDDDMTSNETTTEEVTTELDGGTLEDTKPVLIPDPEKETPPENPEKTGNPTSPAARYTRQAPSACFWVSKNTLR